MFDDIKVLKKSAKKDVQSAYHLALVYYNGDEVKQDYKKALKYFELAQKKGCVKSSCLFYIANCYKEGLGTKVNLKKAFKYFSLAVEAKNTNAILSLAELYRKGLGCKVDEQKAFELYKSADELGNKDAKFFIAECYLNGIGVEANQQKAFAMYQDLAKKGSYKASYNLAYCYQNGYGTEKNYFLSAHYLVPAAKNGDSNAQCFLAICLLRGEGVTQNEEKAVHWFKKASESGNNVALYNYAYCVQNGLGIAKDEAEAFSIFEGLLNKGYNDAIAEVARCYYVGIGVKKNVGKAMKLIKKGIKLKNARCIEFSAYLTLQKKMSSNKVQKKAFNLYKEASQLGSIGAKYVLSQLNEGIEDEEKKICFDDAVNKNYAPALYKAGLDAEKESNADRAIDCFYKASQLQYAPALIKMANYYEDGAFVEKDPEQCFENCQLAYAKDNKEGAYSLARCYDMGIGVDIDETKAFELYLQAGKAGCIDAIAEVGYRYMTGIGVDKNYDNALTCLEKAYNLNSAFAAYVLGLGCQNNKFKVKGKKAIDFYTVACERGYVKSYIKIALLYLNGKKTKNAIFKAFEYFNLALQNGDYEACYYLAKMHAEGLGCEKDEFKTFELIEKGIENGCSSCYYLKGYSCFYGINGFDEDKQGGLNYIIKAGDLGCLEACEFLCKYYGVKSQNHDKAKLLEYKEKATLAGSVNYAYELASMYERGKGVEIDGNKSALLYSKLALSDAKNKKAGIKKIKKYKLLANGQWGNSYIAKHTVVETQSEEESQQNNVEDNKSEEESK